MPGIQTPRSGAPKATAIGSFPGGPNHATTLCTGRSPAIPATRLRRTKAPRDPSRSARNIPCGAPSTKRSSTSHESTATRGSPASHRQKTQQGHPGPGPTPSQTPNECHFVQPATTSPPNPTAKPWTNGVQRLAHRVPRQHHQEGDAEDGFSDWFQSPTQRKENPVEV